MARLKQGDIAITYNADIGIVYLPDTGQIKKTTPNHAKAIEKCLSEYFAGHFSPDEMHSLEDYFEQVRNGRKKLSVEKCPNLLDRKTLSRIEILVANDCNLNCKYCYAQAGSYGRKVARMTPANATEYLSKLIDGRYTAVDRVMFFGGEPTICPETIRAVCSFFAQRVQNKTLDHIPYFTMVSNGTLIDDALASIIKEYDIMLTISIDGPAEINDINRIDKQGNGTFSKIFDGVKLLKMHGIVPKMIEATYTRDHQSRGISREYIKKYLQDTFEVNEVFIADCEEYHGKTDFVPDAPIDGMEALLEIPFNNWRMKCALTQSYFQDFSCTAGHGTFALMPNGDIFPCHFFIEYTEYRMAFFDNGDFNFSNYIAVLEKLSLVRRTVKESCVNCWAKVACHACPARLLLGSEVELTAACERERALQKKLLLKCAGQHD